MIDLTQYHIIMFDRCIITTVDIHTAKKDEEKQPLTELKK